jgi:hypothetical protein
MWSEIILSLYIRKISDTKNFLGQLKKQCEILKNYLYHRGTFVMIKSLINEMEVFLLTASMRLRFPFIIR